MTEVSVETCFTDSKISSLCLNSWLACQYQDPKRKKKGRIIKEACGSDSGFFIIRYHYCYLCCFFHSSSKVSYSLAKICKRYYTLDKLAEKYQPRDFSKIFSGCCESVIMKIIYDCMHQLKLEFYTLMIILCI